MLAGPTQNPWCLRSMSRTVFLDNCSAETDPADEFTFDVSDNKIVQQKNGKTFYVGFDPDRKFSKQKLYKMGTFNESLDKWRITYRG